MKGFWIATAAAAVALSSCADLSQELAVSPIGSDTPTQIPAPGAPTSSGDYAWAAALGDMYEIRASELAVSRANSTAVRDFAELMVADHTASANALGAALSRSGIPATPPAGLDQRRQAMLMALGQVPDAGFDLLYLRQQMAAHQQALTLHLSYAQGGDAMPLRGEAAAAADQVLAHIALLQQIPVG